jgi:hypothetical protein
VSVLKHLNKLCFCVNTFASQFEEEVKKKEIVLLVSLSPFQPTKRQLAYILQFKTPTLIRVGYISMVECLPSMCEDLRSIPSIVKNGRKQKKEGRKDERRRKVIRKENKDKIIKNKLVQGRGCTRGRVCA